MERDETALPFELIIELSRAQSGATPRLQELTYPTYHRREDGGAIKAAKFRWDNVLEDLRKAQRTEADRTEAERKEARDAAGALGARAHELLRDTEWPEDQLSQALAAGRPVRLTFRSAAAELYALPWEMISLRGSSTPLAELPRCLIRYEWPATTTAPRASRAEGGRILLARSEAGGQIHGKDMHTAALRRACREQLDFDEETDVLGDNEALSLRSLDAKLRDASKQGKPYSVLHILCHGQELEDSPGAFGLVWGSSQVEREIVPGPQLGEVLKEHASTLRLVVVCACLSGDAEPESPFGGVAQEVHRAGIEAIVASRFPLSMEGASWFTSAFYEQLILRPASVEEAFLTAREKVKAQKDNITDDVSLQLYARAADGFDTRPIVVRPYRGLEAFDERNRRFFFGRDAEIAETVRDLTALVEAGSPRLLVVAGASGTGKSSMVFAGVVPELKARGWTVLPSIRPGASPMEALARLEDQLGRALEALKSLPPEEQCILLIVDQLEELFTLADARDPKARKGRDAFVQKLWTLGSAPGPRVAVLATMRVDFIGRAGDVVLDPVTGARFDKAVVYRDDHRALVAQMGIEQLRQAIELPARKVGLSLEPGLVDRMLSDAGREPGALPLLQYTLDKLWERREGRELTQSAYDALGGLAGAVATSADALLGKLDEGAKKVARWLFVRLVSIRDDASLDTRRRVALDDLRPRGEGAALFDDVLRCFVDARLLVCDTSAADSQGGAMIEVAHEALIRSWGTLRAWVNEQRKMLSDFDTLRGWAAERRRDERFLLMGRLLERARGILAAYPEQIAADPSLVGAVALIEASEAEARRVEEEKEAQRRRELAQARRAREFSLVAGARELTARGSPWWARKVLVESAEPGLARGWEQLAQDLLATPWMPSAVLRGSAAQLSAAVFSPDGARIVTASFDGTARVFQSDGRGQPLVKEHPNGVFGAAWSPDGKRIVTGCGDGIARVWDAETGADLILLRGPETGVNCVAFDPRGGRIVVGGMDGAARVYRADGSGAPFVLTGHEGVLRSVAFSHDGSRLITAGDQSVRLYDAARPGEPSLVRVLPHGAWVCSASFSADGTRIVTGCADQSVWIWNADLSGEPTVARPGEGSAGPAYVPESFAAFNPAGDRIVVAPGDNTARIWDAGSFVELACLEPEHTLGIALSSAAFSADGRFLVTASNNGVAWVWRAQGAREPTIMRGHKHRVNSAAYSADGRRVVTSSFDRTARVWDTRSGKELLALRGHEDEVKSAAFSPDGARVVTASADRTARVWDAITGKELLALRGHDGPVSSASMSPDGSRLVTASEDRTARVWDATTGQELFALKGHDGPVSCAAYSPDGTRIATASHDGTLRVWSAEQAGDPVFMKPLHGAVISAAYSPDGRRLAAAATEGGAWIWSADGTGEPLHIMLQARAFGTAAWSPDGKRIVTSNYGNDAHVWDADGSGEACTLTETDHVVTSAVFSPDGTHILTASGDTTARIWTVAPRELLEKLRGADTLCLPPDIRRTHLDEAADEARSAYEACERSHCRVPPSAGDGSAGA